MGSGTMMIADKEQRVILALARIGEPASAWRIGQISTSYEERARLTNERLATFVAASLYHLSKQGIVSSALNKAMRNRDYSLTEIGRRVLTSFAADELYAVANHPILDWLLTDGRRYIPEPQQTS